MKSCLIKQRQSTDLFCITPLSPSIKAHILFNVLIHFLLQWLGEFVLTSGNFIFDDHALYSHEIVRRNYALVTTGI